jgi:uncharacterized protein YndB with AHSA1/START domain/predicted enzyme related to lactoylglutathione lyase
MDWTLEVVQVPVTDVERAVAFYAGKLGFALDFDQTVDEKTRFAQLTPPGSGCSLVVSTGMSEMEPGTQRGAQLVVADLRAAHEGLVAAGVENSGITVYGTGGQRPAVEGDELDNVGFVRFADPDGNVWLVQQISTRAAHDLAVTRVLDAPPEQAWRAWSDGGYVMRWWGPTGFTSPSAEMDFRVGGTSLVCMRAPAEYGGQDMYNSWTYTALVEPERIEFVLDFVDAAGEPLDDSSIPPGVRRPVPHVITLRPTTGGAEGGVRTELTVREFGYATAEARDISRAGLEQCLDKLEAIFRRVPTEAAR